MFYLIVNLSNFCICMCVFLNDGLYYRAREKCNNKSDSETFGNARKIYLNKLSKTKRRNFSNVMYTLLRSRGKLLEINK